MLTLIGATTVRLTMADLTEDQMTGQWHRWVGTFLTPESLPRAKAALSSNCSEARAAQMYAAMTILLKSSNDDQAKADQRLKAIASRLSQYPEVVVGSVLAEWAENEGWHPAWADLKQPADRAFKTLQALISATERRNEQEAQDTLTRREAPGEERTGAQGQPAGPRDA
jgi:hypothetical protein